MERHPKKMGIINWKETNKLAVEALRDFELTIDVTKELEQYSVAVQQMVVIARALQMKPRILVLDEPTSSMNNQEVGLLFKVLRRLKDEGCAIIFVSHYLDQVYDICDRITLLEKGENAGSWRIDEISPEELEGKIEKLADSIDPDYLEDSEVERPVMASKPEAYGIVLDSLKDITLPEILESGKSEVRELEFSLVANDAGKSRNIRTECVCVKEPVLNLLAMDLDETGEDEDLTLDEGILQALEVKRGWFSMLSRENQLEYAAVCLDMFEIPQAVRQERMAKLDSELHKKVARALRLVAASEYIMLAGSDGRVDLAGMRKGQQIVALLTAAEAYLLILPLEVAESIESADCKEFWYEV